MQIIAYNHVGPCVTDRARAPLTCFLRDLDSDVLQFNALKPDARG